MYPLVIAALLAAIVPAVTASIAVPVISRVAMAVPAVDYPGGRRFHGAAVPRMGGIAIAIGIEAAPSSRGRGPRSNGRRTVMKRDLVAVCGAGGFIGGNGAEP